MTRIYHKKAYCAFSCHNLAMHLEKIGKKSMTLLTATDSHAFSTFKFCFKFVTYIE